MHAQDFSSQIHSFYSTIILSKLKMHGIYDTLDLSVLKFYFHKTLCLVWHAAEAVQPAKQIPKTRFSLTGMIEFIKSWYVCVKCRHALTASIHRYILPFHVEMTEIYSSSIILIVGELAIWSNYSYKNVLKNPWEKQNTRELCLYYAFFLQNVVEHFLSHHRIIVKTRRWCTATANDKIPPFNNQKKTK